MTREEAIDIIRDTYHTETELEALKVLIPELKDSEDERIRKEIISFLQDDIDRINCRVSGDYDDRDEDDIEHQNWCKKAIAYLEKQKEQKMLAVDLEKEIQRYLCEECSSDDEPTIKEIAHHFYELGLKAKEE